MKFKRLLSGISAFAVAASAFAGLAVTANASTNLYTQDFESIELSDLTYSLAGNTTARLQTNTGGNATTFFNYYVDGGSGNRASTLSLPDAYGAEVPVKFSLLIRMMGSNQNGSTFEVRDSNNVALFNFSANSYLGSPTINGEAVTLETANPGAGVMGVSNYTASGWLKFEGIVDFSAETKLLDLTVTDITNGDTVVYTKKYSTTASDIKTLYGSIGRANGAFAYDDIVIDQLDASELPQTATYTVTYDVAGKTAEEYVTENESVSDIPDTYNPGYTFKGWAKDDDIETIYTTDEVKAMAITADTKFTAQYEADTLYVEAIESVSIIGADSMTFGADPDTAASNPYTVVIRGADGTVITEANLSSNVTDFNVAWDIDGFATENDTEGQYCDSYGEFTVNDSAAVATDFALRNVPMNFYGKMTAAVTYNGDIYTAEKYVVALGNTAVDTNQILPEGGYPSDFDAYPESIVGYQTQNDTYGTAFDTIVGGWVMSGSDSATAIISSEDGNKYIRITAKNSSKSHMFTNSITSPVTQAIFEQDVRFHSNGGTITLTSKYPFWGNGFTNPVTVTYSGSALTLNGTAVTDANDNNASISTGSWYKLVLSIDKTTQTAFLKVYDAEGAYVGGADNVAWTEESNPTYYSIGMTNSSTGSIDFDNYSAYYPIADSSQYTLTASQDTLSIPNGDTADLAAALKTADGYEMTGAAMWTVLEDDMKEGIIVTPDESDSHKATVALGSAAEAGTATVQVNIGGYTKTITLNITSSAESVKFTQSNSSISIPLDDKNTTAEYNAIVVDGNGTDLDRIVTYAIYDKNNTTVYTLPTGITFENGVLTVTKNAPAVIFTIRATGKNTDNEDISKSVRVTVHGLSFDFGAGADDDISEGYTSVSPDTSYTETRGYGVDSGSVTAGGTASVTNANEDYLEGAFTFKANVQKGKNYTVDITYQGKLVTGYVNSDLAGYTLGEQESLATASYIVPVPVDTLDLAVSGDGAKIAAITITKNTDKTANVKPNIFHVGDSTAANNGSWAYVFNNTYSSYEDFARLATFSNNGAGGRNLCTYYTQGKLASVLRAIKPGDIVMFGNNGTNGMGSYFETDVNYYLDAAEAMGAKIIINSYTPHGAVNNYSGCYDSATNTFNGWRQDSYDVIVRRIAEERAASDPNYLGFVEIGKNADAAFNAYVADYAANGYDSADAAAQAIIACFSDHNHYSEAGLARNLMLNGYGDVNGIAAQLVAILASNTPEPPAEGIEIKSFGELVSYPEAAAAGAEVTNNTDEAITVDVIMAEHDADGKLVRVSLNAIEIAAGATENVSASINIMNDDWTTIKAYLWNASANNTPLANVLNVVDKGTYQ